MSFEDTYESGFCRAGNHRSCKQHFCIYGDTPALTCICVCHRLQEFVHELGEKTAAEVLAERCGKCQ